ncbi:TetR/AcrR family transcriptional regulator [Brevibacterium sp. UMB1308A]|uniref:TetR/AcrR family transcriptional regulator n=1 Tax=Brevibacterium sp. UMB1308A TaxID=3050608 RepID=UPI002550B77C|nr:TetR/AcrR family transcriptional regulator [Brevibacterium sp. UMB1308A]MDK8347560.1 TetR/AcrR family transcriptional regulator [Brevibacterium sp. UMB1308B]MDK8714499.1 TetR/AcrR family transcriptional regulator [Brevibacterium sp. UMB1308A]
MTLHPGVAPTARRQRTRNRLLGAAVTAFARNGIVSTPIEELCEEAGMTRGAFYSNFTSTDELVVNLIDCAVEHTIAGIRGVIATTEDTYSTDQATHTSDPSTRFINLRKSAKTAFTTQRLGWTTSVAWTITEAEIELYSIRNPDVRERYLELQNAQVRAVGVEVEQLLARHGARTTIPIQTAIRHLAATDIRTARQSIPPRAVELAPTPDASELVSHIMGKPGAAFDTSKLPEHSLLHPVERDLGPVLDLLSMMVEF